MQTALILFKVENNYTHLVQNYGGRSHTHHCPWYEETMSWCGQHFRTKDRAQQARWPSTFFSQRKAESPQPLDYSGLRLEGREGR